MANLKIIIVTADWENKDAFEKFSNTVTAFHEKTLVFCSEEAKEKIIIINEDTGEITNVLA